VSRNNSTIAIGNQKSTVIGESQTLNGICVIDDVIDGGHEFGEDWKTGYSVNFNPFTEYEEALA
jgi:hypothetical protein